MERLRRVLRHVRTTGAADNAAVPDAPTITVDPDTGLGYADLELSYKLHGKGATPARLRHLERYGVRAHGTRRTPGCP
jgi:hypothetical protein